MGMDIIFSDVSLFNTDFFPFDDEVQRRPYIMRARINHFDLWDDGDFFIRFRLKKQTFLNLLSKVEPNLILSWNNRTRSLSPMNQLLLTLRFYATRSFHRVCGDFSGVSVSTSSRVVKRVSAIIASLYRETVYMPRNAEEIQTNQLKFYAMHGFSRVVGCIDCTHVRIQSPGGENAESFRNRKGYFSLNVQAVCDVELSALNIVARWPGSAHDSTIFSHSSLQGEFVNNKHGNGILLGDSAYPLKTYLLTPIINPLTPEETRYNESQVRTRNVIERFFGVWKRRFPVLSIGIRLKIDTVMDVIIATGVLYNIAKNQMVEEPPVLDLAVIQENNQQINEPNLNFSEGDNTTRRTIIENFFRT